MTRAGSFNLHMRGFVERTELLLLFRWIGLSLVLILAFTEPSSGQARALLLFGQAGRMYPLANLGSDAGDDMSPGRAFGGGLGFQVGPTAAIRAMVNVSRSNLRGPTVSFDDSTFTRSYIGLDLMFGAPSDAGLAPYIFFGGGRLCADPGEPGVDTLVKPAGRLGTGMNYVPDNSFFVFFVEAAGWLYDFELLGFSSLQFDTALMGGLAFAVPF